MKNAFVVAVALCAAGALAMPTKDELTKAQTLVAELMAPAMADFKAAGAKDKAATAVKVADASVEFANAAQTEAAKFLLLKGAVNFYTRGEAYDKAADAVADLQAKVKDVRPEVIAEITRNATSKISEAKAPRLFALYRMAKLQVRAASEAKDLEQKLKKVKSDALQRRYAEALAVSGDWKAAYAEFAKLSNAKLKSFVEAEAEGKAKNSESGEFWWSYEPVMEDADDVFKIHAVAFYRKALDAGEIAGLKKNIVEQRIKSYGDAAGGLGTGASPRTRTASGMYCVVDLSGGPNEAIESEAKPKESQQDKSLAVKSKNGVDSDIIDLLVVGADPIRLIKCPAGAFKMGFEDGASPFVRHKVKISRPFWMSEAPITVGQYCAFMGVFEDRFKPRHDVQPADGLRRVSEAMGGASAAISGVTLEEIAAFCGKLSAAFAQKVPQGCVFRLPTDAEWAYAFSCGGKNKDRNYAALAKGEKSPSFAEIAVDGFEVAQKYLKQENVRFRSNDAWMISAAAPRYRVKTCRPNTWGFYDMAGLCWERLADTIPPLKNGTHSWSEEGKSLFVNQYVQHANSQEVDPVMVYDGNGGLSFSVSCNGGANPWAKWVNEPGRHWDVGFRLVVGPDLVSEWKEKHANGGMRSKETSTRTHAGERSYAAGLGDEHQMSLAEKQVQQLDVSVVDVHTVKSDISVSQSTKKLAPKAAEQATQEKQGCREDLVPAEKIEPEQAASRDYSGILIGLAILMCLVNVCLLVRRW